MGSIHGLGRSLGGGKWPTNPVCLPEKSHGQRSLAGYSLKGHKESDMTERLSIRFVVNLLIIFSVGSKPLYLVKRIRNLSH